jgi:hypothetical protein
VNRYIVSASLVLCACGGERLTEGFDEPFRVASAQFIAGKLPGSRPLTSEEVRAGKTAKVPYSTTPDIAGRVLDPRSADLGISGRASPQAYSVGLQLADVGTGYWLLPVGAPDPLNNNELVWSARLDFNGLAPGLRYLRVAALDENQKSGTQRSLELCIRSPIPDNLNACEPSLSPPELVVSLGWDSFGDLDLSVVAPSGEVIDYARGNDAKDKTNSGKFTGDGGTGCVQSGARRENVVWEEHPEKGRYLVYVNLHDACGERATPFVLTTHGRKKKGDNYTQVETYRAASEALAVQANGGQNKGLFITEFVVD